MEINNRLQLRHCTIEDIALLLPLMEQFGRPVTQDVLSTRFQSFTQNSGYGVVIACINSQPIGLIAWSKSQFFICDKMRFYIEMLVVDARYRRCGVGTKLIECVEDFARTVGPSVIDLTSHVRREKDGAHAFYKKLRYQNEGEREKRYFRKEL
jgi:ribosomal protein S18 acetylase RimI-like enzyme